MPTTLSCLLGWAALAGASSLAPRVVSSLDEAATAEAHQRDNGATRAFSDVQIKTSDGKCLFVDKLSGDFRANLTPVQVADCGGTDGQGWDIITKGTHISGDNVMLIVSTLTQACLNFDGRRAAGNQVLLFSCGGRADGGGAVTDSQIFGFDGSAGPLALEPQNQSGSCLTVNGNVLDVASCASGNPNQAFTLGGAAASTPGTGNAGDEAEKSETSADRGATPSPSPRAGSSTSCTQRTRTITAPAIDAKRTLGAFGAKFRGQKAKKITKTSPAALPTTVVPGNDLGAAAPSSSAADSVVPSETTAVAVSARPEAVVSSSAGAVASSPAEVVATSSTKGETATRRRTKTTRRGKTKTAKATGTTQTAVAVPSAEVSSLPAASSSVTSSSDVLSSAVSAAAGSEVSSSVPLTTAAPGGIPTANPTAPVPVSGAGGVLQPSAAAEAHQRDATATRAFSGVSIRAPNGQCLFIDPTAGDFRQNLIPVSLVDCTGAPNEKWDIITAGKHNAPSRQPATLVVSTMTQGCISFDGRRDAGDTVTLFSCGGRADGGGATSSGQQFPYLGQLSFAFAPVSEGNRTCILPGNGRLESGACPTDGAQLFSIFT